MKPSNATHSVQVERDGYTVVQSPNNHVHIYGPDGRMISHASCTKKMTERELDEHLYFVLKNFRRAVKHNG